MFFGKYTSASTPRGSLETSLETSLEVPAVFLNNTNKFTKPAACQRCASAECCTVRAEATSCVSKLKRGSGPGPPSEGGPAGMVAWKTFGISTKRRVRDEAALALVTSPRGDVAHCTFVIVPSGGALAIDLGCARPRPPRPFVSNGPIALERTAQPRHLPSHSPSDRALVLAATMRSPVTPCLEQTARPRHSPPIVRSP